MAIPAPRLPGPDGEPDAPRIPTLMPRAIPPARIAAASPPTRAPVDLLVLERGVVMSRPA
jgi:hypothetical protein